VTFELRWPEAEAVAAEANNFQRDRQR
jgi:hypothetical protein